MERSQAKDPKNGLLWVYILHWVIVMAHFVFCNRKSKKYQKVPKLAWRSHPRRKFTSQNFLRTYQNVDFGFEIFKIGPEMAILGQIKLTDF